MGRELPSDRLAAKAIKVSESVDQRIEAPTALDIDRIARSLIHAESVAKEIAGRSLDGSRADLASIQAVLDAGAVERDAAYTLQCLGLAFGKVFVEETTGFDWWMVEDEFGRDPAIRFGQTSLLAFPQTMILKRIESGESVDLESLFDQFSERMHELAEEQSENS